MFMASRFGTYFIPNMQIGVDQIFPPAVEVDNDDYILKTKLLQSLLQLAEPPSYCSGLEPNMHSDPIAKLEHTSCNNS